jgi:hypothetical protein
LHELVFNGFHVWAGLSCNVFGGAGL